MQLGRLVVVPFVFLYLWFAYTLFVDLGRIAADTARSPPALEADPLRVVRVFCAT